MLPALLVFALGLTLPSRPLTATVLADADETDAGIASAINNAIARVAGLIGISAIGVVVGRLIGDTFAPNPESVHGFHGDLDLRRSPRRRGRVVGLFGILKPRRAVPPRAAPAGSSPELPSRRPKRDPGRVGDNRPVNPQEA